MKVELNETSEGLSLKERDPGAVEQAMAADSELSHAAAAQNCIFHRRHADPR